MGKPRERAPLRSLDRLKTLDARESLELQLQEASRLCNTGERASMVTRWLLGKMNKDDQARNCPQSWTLLQDAIRLQMPDRIAAVLGQFNTIDQIRTATQRDEPSDVVTTALNLLDLLLNISKGPAATAMKSYLRLDSKHAAELLGNTLRCSNNSAHHAAVLNLWALRKVSSNDHDAFSQYCLVAAAETLTTDATTGPSGKRSRDGKNISHGISSSVERLVAQHIFQPARLALFAQQTSDVLEKAVAPLKLHYATEAESSAARLLDVALRCVASTTPKQRKEELPWVEAVFNALKACIPDGPGCNALISQMLNTVQELGHSLSHETLSNIIAEYSGLLDDASDVIDHDLLAQVAALDAAFFMTEPFASQLIRHLPSSRELEYSIITPVVRAYARHRSLLRFFERWHDVLEEHNETSSLLRVDFRHVLEDSVPAEEIVTLVQNYCTHIEKGNVSAAIPLASILNAVQTDDLRDGLQSQLHHLLKLSMRPRQASDFRNAKWECSLWDVYTVAFELYFPVMVMKAKDATTVASDGMKYLQTAQVEHWLHVTESSESIHRSLREEGEFINALSTFLATTCIHLSPYEECRPKCENIAGRLVEHPFLWIHLATHPGLITICGSDETRETLLRESLVTDLDHVKEAVLYCCERSASIRDSLLTIALEILRTDPANSDQVVNWLLEVNLQKLSQEQRDSFLEILTDPSPANLASDNDNEEKVQRRLAALCRLMDCSLRSKIRVPFDVSVIVRLGNSVQDPQALTLLCHLTGLILTHSKTLDDKTQLQNFVDNLIGALNLKKLKKKCDTTTLEPLSAASKISHLLVMLKACYKTEVLQPEQLSNITHMLIGRAQALPVGKAGSHELLELLDMFVYLPRTCVDEVHAEAIMEIAGETLEHPDATASERAAAFSLACQHTDGEAGQALADLVEPLLDKGLPSQHYNSVLDSYRGAISGCSVQIKFDICQAMLSTARARPYSAIPVLRQTLRTMGKDVLESADMTGRYTIYMDLLQLLQPAPSYGLYYNATECIAQVLAEQSFLVNQHGAEATLAAIIHQVCGASPEMRALVNVNACRITTILLQRHEHRLKGRFHLLTQLLQALLSSVFRGTADPSSRHANHQRESTTEQLQVLQAKHFSRVVTFLCNPRQVQSKRANGLADEARKAKAHIGEFIRHTLHHYCAEVLKNPAPEPMRQALLPGLFAMIDAILVSDVDGMNSLSAAMNNSQRNILRSLYDEWKRIAKWTGG